MEIKNWIIYDGHYSVLHIYYGYNAAIEFFILIYLLREPEIRGFSQIDREHWEPQTSFGLVKSHQFGISVNEREQDVHDRP